MDHDRRELREGACARLRSERRKPRNCPHKRGFNTKIHLAVDARGVPVRCVVTDGVTADCAKAGELIENTGARGLIADRGYDSDKIVQNAENLGMKVVIPPRKKSKSSAKLRQKCLQNQKVSRKCVFIFKTLARRCN